MYDFVAPNKKQMFMEKYNGETPTYWNEIFIPTDDLMNKKNCVIKIT